MADSSIMIENLTATRTGEISINSFDSIEIKSPDGKQSAKISIQNLAGGESSEPDVTALANPPTIFTYINNGQILTITIAE